MEHTICIDTIYTFYFSFYFTCLYCLLCTILYLVYCEKTLSYSNSDCCDKDKNVNCTPAGMYICATWVFKVPKYVKRLTVRIYKVIRNTVMFRFCNQTCACMF